MLSALSQTRLTCHRARPQISRQPYRVGEAGGRVVLQPTISCCSTASGSSSSISGRGSTATASTAWPAGTYSIDMQVRDYELDQFNVVNNAVFPSYLQHARHEALAVLGHDVDETARSGTALALSELNLKFKAPLRSRDKFRVKVWVQKVAGVRAVIGQQIVLLPKQPSSDPQVVLEAEAVVVWLDGAYRPTRIPAHVRADLTALHHAWVEASGADGAQARAA